MPSFFAFHQCKCSAGMWWTGLLILHALGASCQRTGPEYLSNESGARSGRDLKWSDADFSFQDTAERDLGNKGKEPLAIYLYLRNKDDVPVEVDCLKCLEPFLINKTKPYDFCSCLPCVKKFSERDIKISQNLITYFLSLDCTKREGENLSKTGGAKQLRQAAGNAARDSKMMEIERGSRADRKLSPDYVSSWMRNRQMFSRTSKDNDYPESEDYLDPSGFQSVEEHESNPGAKENQHEEKSEEDDNSEEFLTSDELDTSTDKSQNDCRFGYCKKDKEPDRKDKEMGKLEESLGVISKDSHEKLKKVFGELMKKLHETKKKNLGDSHKTNDQIANNMGSRRQHFEDISKFLKSPKQRRYGLDIYMNKYNRPSYKLHAPINGRKTKRPSGNTYKGGQRSSPRSQILESRRELNEPISDLHKSYSSGMPNSRQLHPKTVKEVEVQYKNVKKTPQPSGRRKNLMRISRKNKKRINFKKSNKSPLKQLLEDAELVGNSASNIAKNILDSRSRNAKAKEAHGMREVTTAKNKIEPKRKSKEVVPSDEIDVEESTTMKNSMIRTVQRNKGSENDTASTTTVGLQTRKPEKIMNRLMGANSMPFKSDILGANLAATTEEAGSRSLIVDTPKEDDDEYEGESILESSMISYPDTLPRFKANKQNEEVSLKSENSDEKSSEDEDEEMETATPPYRKAAVREIATKSQTGYGTNHSGDLPSLRSLYGKSWTSLTTENFEKRKMEEEDLLELSTRSLVPTTEAAENVTQNYESRNGDRNHNEEEDRDKVFHYENKNIHGFVVKHRKSKGKPVSSEPQDDFDIRNGKNGESQAAKGKKKSKTGGKNPTGTDEESENSLSTIIIVKGNPENPNQSILINVKLNDGKETDDLMHLLDPIMEETKKAAGLHNEKKNKDSSKGENESDESREVESDPDPDYVPEDESEEYDYELRASHDPEFGGSEKMPESGIQTPRTRKSQKAFENHGHARRDASISESEEGSTGNAAKIRSGTKWENFGGGIAPVIKSRYGEEVRRHLAEAHGDGRSAFPNPEANTPDAMPQGRHPMPAPHLTRRGYEEERERFWNDFRRSYWQWKTRNDDI